MLRANRVSEAQVQVEQSATDTTTDTQVDEAAQRKAHRAPRAPRKRAVSRASEVVTVDEASHRMTTYLHSSNRDRARAAYRATNHLEGDKSWSDFVERAIVAETIRRESAHNAGEPYQGDSSPLPAGRPLS
jgi:predicted glutamine amidotransferase